MLIFIIFCALFFLFLVHCATWWRKWQFHVLLGDLLSHIISFTFISGADFGCSIYWSRQELWRCLNCCLSLIFFRIWKVNEYNILIINSIQKLHVPFFKKYYQNYSEIQLTLKSRMPSLWNAHLALAWTKRLGIFLPEFLQRFLHHQSSVSNLSVWIFVWRRPPCTTGWAKKKT